MVENFRRIFKIILENNGNEAKSEALVKIEEETTEVVKSEESVHESEQNEDYKGPRPSMVLLAVGLVVSLLVLSYMFISSSKAGGKDVVSDYKVVSERFSTPSFIEAMKTLKGLPADQREAYLATTFPRLHEDVVYYLRERGKLQTNETVQNVEFLFGSATSVKAEDGDGNVNQGKFDDQLVARVTIVGRDKPMDVIVHCLNGTFNLPGDLQSLGNRIPKQKFTIAAGEGLTAHVAMATAVDLAKRFNLPMYRGKKISSSNSISVEQAGSLDTDKVQVTVYVVEGDTFDLVNMTITPSPKRKVR